MKAHLDLVLLSLAILLSSCHGPLYYRLNTIRGTVYDTAGNAVLVDFTAKRRLTIENCSNDQLETFLRTLTIARHGRMQLEYLLTSPTKVRIHISEQTGIMLKDGKYRLIAGITGPQNDQSNYLIENSTCRSPYWRLLKKDQYCSVHEETTLEVFKGSVAVGHDSSIMLTSDNVRLFDWASNQEIAEFTKDTIALEPLMYPELLYRSERELYYFVGVHEICHLRPENVEQQELGKDPEIDAIGYELKAFRRRGAVNRRGFR